MGNGDSGETIKIVKLALQEILYRLANWRYQVYMHILDWSYMSVLKGKSVLEFYSLMVNDLN